jgi:DNA-binding transcriptional MerR regulator
VSNDQAPGSLEARPRREGSIRSKASDSLDHARKPSWVPPVIKEDTVQEAPKSPKSEADSSAPSEDGFSRFYNTFGSLINRLSAPLAFAGLPLISEESTSAATTTVPSEPASRRPRQRPSTSTAEPDLSKIYSRATLRSLARDGHGPSDSFYVVPTSGHTASYASILNHENKEKRRMAASLHRGNDDADDNEDDDDFVDARESQATAAPPLSPTQRKRLNSRGSRGDRDLRNTLEELQLENASLKDVLDKVSKRLHAFELNSQTSHLALAQSLRLQRPGSPMSSSGGAGHGSGPGDEALRRRNRELEEQLAELSKRMAELERDHVKLQQTVEKYRERWEKLKAGAKARREAQEQANDGEGSRK